jgi:hypothetical protein
MDGLRFVWKYEEKRKFVPSFIKEGEFAKDLRFGILGREQGIRNSVRRLTPDLMGDCVLPERRRCALRE